MQKRHIRLENQVCGKDSINLTHPPFGVLEDTYTIS